MMTAALARPSTYAKICGISPDELETNIGFSGEQKGRKADVEPAE